MIECGFVFTLCSYILHRYSNGCPRGKCLGRAAGDNSRTRSRTSSLLLCALKIKVKRTVNIFLSPFQFPEAKNNKEVKGFGKNSFVLC